MSSVLLICLSVTSKMALAYQDLGSPFYPAKSESDPSISLPHHSFWTASCLPFLSMSDTYFSLTGSIWMTSDKESVILITKLAY